MGSGSNGEEKTGTFDAECNGVRHAVLVLNVGIDSTFSTKTVGFYMHMIHHIRCILNRIPCYKIDVLLGMHRKSLL